MQDFEATIDGIFAKGEERSQRLRALFAAPDDLTSLTLRGHLVLEELMIVAVSAHCRNPEHLSTARLRFPQLVSLLRALEKITAVAPKHWEALLELNSLRNALAHRLAPEDLEARVSRFVSMVIDSGFKSAPEPRSSRAALEACLHFLIGAFEVVAVWHNAVEELLHHQATTNKG